MDLFGDVNQVLADLMEKLTSLRKLKYKQISTWYKLPALLLML